MINPLDIEKFYEMLRHEKQTELRAINPETKEIKTFHFSSKESLIQLCSEMDTKFNLYLGVNERKLNGTKSEDVVNVGVIPVDIDCVNKPASDADIIEANTITTKIIEDGLQHGFKKSMVAFSGNGFQIYFAVPKIAITDENRQEVEDKIQEFERRLIEKYSTDKVRLDNVGDLARIMRIAGTFNLKSKTYSKLFIRDWEEDKELADFILSLQVAKGEIVGGLTEELKNKIKSDEIIQKFFNGDLQGRTSRSEAELSLVCRLVQLNMTKEQIFRIMASCKIGKWQEANIKYRELTYKKALEIICKEKESKSEISIEDYQRVALQIYNEIIDVLKDYIVMKEEHYSLVALWIIGTYFHEDFETYPFLFINATKGSGKTRLLKLIASLSKDGEVLTSLSDAVLFRTGSGKTYCIDEFERVGQKEKASLRELLNASYKKGSKVKRMRKMKDKQGENMVVEEFELDASVCMANIWGMDEVLGDRCLTIILEKSTNRRVTKLMEDFASNLAIKRLNELLGEFKCRLCRVVYEKKHITTWNNYIKNKYINDTTTTTLTTPTTLTTLTSYISQTDKTTLNTHTNTTNSFMLELFDKIDKSDIYGRTLELFFPLFILSYSINSQIFENLVNFAMDENVAKKDDERIENSDVMLVEFIAQKQDTLDFEAMTKLTNDFRNYVLEEDEENKWINTRWVGRALKRLNLVLKKRRLNRGREVILNHKKAREMIRAYKDEKEIAEEHVI